MPSSLSRKFANSQLVFKFWAEKFENLKNSIRLSSTAVADVRNWLNSDHEGRFARLIDTERRKEERDETRPRENDPDERKKLVVASQQQEESFAPSDNRLWRNKKARFARVHDAVNFRWPRSMQSTSSYSGKWTDTLSLRDLLARFLFKRSWRSRLGIKGRVYRENNSLVSVSCNFLRTQMEL